MGRILTIRVTAVTFDESQAARAWPVLCSLAWPGEGEVEDGEWKRVLLPRTLEGLRNVDLPKHGVLELAQALADQARFGGWPAETKNALADGLARLEKTREALEAALGDWKPGDANRAGDALEDALDDMEKLLR